VDASDTVGNVKAKLHDREDIQPFLQRLISTDKQSADGRSLPGYFSLKQSNLPLVLCLRGGIQTIFVRILTGMTATVNVEASDNSSSSEACSWRTGAFAELLIQKESTLHLVLRLECGS
jgi:hypothetical protein